MDLYRRSLPITGVKLRFALLHLRNHAFEGVRVASTVVDEHVPTMEQRFSLRTQATATEVSVAKEEVDDEIRLPLLRQIHREKRWILRQLLYVK